MEGDLMIDKASEKIKQEIEKEKNPYVQVVGEFLLQHIGQNPQDAEKLLANDKTILKSLDEMKKVAEKKKVGNVAVLTDQEGFEVVLKYFEIGTKPVQIVKKPSEFVNQTSKNVTESIDFDVKLDDFLGV